MLRSGKRPDDTAITVMPFESLRELNDVNAKAVFHQGRRLQRLAFFTDTGWQAPT